MAAMFLSIEYVMCIYHLVQKEETFKENTISLISQKKTGLRLFKNV